MKAVAVIGIGEKQFLSVFKSLLSKNPKLSDVLYEEEDCEGSYFSKLIDEDEADKICSEAIRYFRDYGMSNIVSVDLWNEEYLNVYTLYDFGQDKTIGL